MMRSADGDRRRQPSDAKRPGKGAGPNAIDAPMQQIWPENRKAECSVLTRQMIVKGFTSII